MPASKKTTLWFAVNMALGCLVEIAQYLKAIFEVAENKPTEIIARLDQIIEVLPACMNLGGIKFDTEELRSAGLTPSPYGPTGQPLTPQESSQDMSTTVGLNTVGTKTTDTISTKDI